MATDQLGELRQAVRALYNAEHCLAADAYLKAARQREGFWALALQLLTASSPGTAEEQFFGAHALRVAARRAQDMLLPEVGQPLAVELARLTHNAAAGQHWAIANQLAGALAELALRAPWWEVGSLVADTLRLLGTTAAAAAATAAAGKQLPQEGVSRLHAALLVLAALAEACQSRDVSLHPACRAAAAAALAADCSVAAVAEAALAQQGAPGCQLAALGLLQGWATLPGAACALQLQPGTLAGLHQAVLASPAAATQAAETVAALYGACASAPCHPASLALLQQLLPHLHSTAGGAMQAAQASSAQHSAQLLNAAATILSSAAGALLAQLSAQAEGEGGGGGQQSEEEAAQLCGRWWEVLGLVAGNLLELLQHPDPEVAIAALQPWDEALLPGLGRLVSMASLQRQQPAAAAQQAQRLLERLCGGLLLRMALPAGIGSHAATADARDLPGDVRMVRRELSDSFRAAVSALGTQQAVQHLLGLASDACAAWQAGGDPAQGWHQAECALYALNLVLPRHLAQQAGQGHDDTRRALGLCLAALQPAAPKLAGTALTLVGGLAEPLADLQSCTPARTAAAAAAAGSSSGSYRDFGDRHQADSFPRLLDALLGLLCSKQRDAKLRRNAATAVHRLCASTRLAAVLAARHAGWARSLAEAYLAAGGLQQAPSSGEDLCTEEFLLRALCHLGRARAAGGGQPGASEWPAASGSVDALVPLLLTQAAAGAAAALAQLEQASGSGRDGVPAAAAAAAQLCGARLEVIAVVLETALAPGSHSAVLEQPLCEAWQAAQRAVSLLAPSRQLLLPLVPEQPHLAPLLRGACRAVGAMATAAPTPAVLRSALSTLQPLLSEAPHPCLLEALQAVAEAAALAGAAGDLAFTGMHPNASGSQSTACNGPGPCCTCSSADELLPGLAQSLAAALHGSSRHADDPQLAVPSLRLGAAVARVLPSLVALPPGSIGGPSHGAALLPQLLDWARHGAQSWHREVCEATLDLAAALCCCLHAAAAQAEQAQQAEQQGGAAPPRDGPGCRSGLAADADSAGGRLVLWLLLGASGAMPPYMVQPTAEALHGLWAAVGSDRFGSWLGQAVLGLAPPGAPWRGWKQEALQAALADLLACQADSKRFKRQLKVLCGGKKKGRHVDAPARRQ